MACFLDLPRELRDQIYGYCLIVQGVLVVQPGHSGEPTAPRYRGGSPPALALLSVNQQINQEAAPIFYGKNCWRILADYSAEPDFCFYEKHGSLLRHVNFSNFSREREIFGYLLMQNEREDLRESYRKPAGSTLAVRRACLVRHLRLITTLTLSLNSPEHDLASLCRPATLDHVWTHLLSQLIPTRHHESPIPSLKEIRILGLRSKEEKMFFIERAGGDGGGDEDRFVWPSYECLSGCGP